MSPNNTGVRFPNRITRIRHIERLKLAELARIVGVSRRHLTDVEAGRKVPNAALIHDLAEALHTSMRELFAAEWSVERSAKIREARTDVAGVTSTILSNT